MSCAESLIRQLTENGVNIYLDIRGGLQFSLPDPLPDHLVPLLKEALANEESLREYLAYLMAGRNPFVLSDVRRQLAGGVDPLDYYYNVEKQAWIVDPGWWKRIPRDKLH